MPRYFFHRTDGFVDHDHEGTELANLRAARLEAVKYAGQCLSADPEIVWNGQEFRIEVTDARGEVLMTVMVLTVDSPTRRRGIPL